MVYKKIEVENGKDLRAKMEFLGIEKTDFASSIGKTRTTLYAWFELEKFKPKIKKILEEVGFLDVNRVSANTSTIKDFPFYPLDIDDEGKPRKGAESMYVEATKP